MKTFNNEYGDRLDITTTVEFIENAILAGKSRFVVRSEIGSIAVEYNTEYEESVVIIPWIDAPNTKWVMSREADYYDYYLSIRPAKKHGLTHARVVMAVSKMVLMLNFKADDIPDEAIDAAVKAYMSVFDDGIPMVNVTADQWISENMSPRVRRDASVKALVREYLTRRDENADTVLARADRLFKQDHRLATRVPYEGYSRHIIGLILYIQDEMPKTVVVTNNRNNADNTQQLFYTL